MDIPFFPKKDEWEIIIDEVPQLDHCYQFNLPRNLGILTEHIALTEPVNDSVGLVVPKGPNRLKRHLDLIRDDVDEHFKEFLKCVLSESRDVLVEIQDWKRLVEDRAVSSNEDRNQITFLSLLNKRLLRVRS